MQWCWHLITSCHSVQVWHDALYDIRVCMGIYQVVTGCSGMVDEELNFITE